jgi:hypothetical protein
MEMNMTEEKTTELGDFQTIVTEVRLLERTPMGQLSVEFSQVDHTFPPA